MGTSFKSSLTPFLIDIIKKSFTDGKKNIFEFGSRYGEDSTALATAFPDAHIYTFECNPNTLEVCRNECKKYNNITLTEKAVSNICDQITFYPINKSHTQTTWEDGNQGASSLLQASGEYPVEKYVQDKIVTNSITLKSFMEENFIEKIDFLWMDIQGAELMALQGLDDYIDKVNTIYTEVEFMEIYKNQPLFSDIKKFLEKNSFKFVGFLYKGQFSGDALFVNRRNEHIYNNIKKIFLQQKSLYTQIKERLELFFKYN